MITGNGDFDVTNQDYGDSFIKCSPANGLAVTDYFTPYDQLYLESVDGDLGSGGQILLPDSAGSTNHPHLMIGGGKEGTLYLLDRDNMGHYNTNDDSQVVQTLVRATYGSYCTPAYLNHRIYYGTYGSGVTAYTITNGMLASPKVQSSDVSFGGTPSVSANGNSNGLVWLIKVDNFYFGPNGQAALTCLNAADVTRELYDSGTISPRDDPGPAIKMSVPTIANGRVYVPVQGGVSVFGLGNFLAVPAISPASSTFNDSITVSLADETPGTAIYYTLDDTIPTTNSIRYTAPFAVSNSTGVQARAFKPGTVDSAVVTAAFLKTSAIGTGTGLTGSYYANVYEEFLDSPTLTRLDPQIDFDWTMAPPESTDRRCLFQRLLDGSGAGAIERDVHHLCERGRWCAIVGE